MIRVLFVCHGNICRSPMAEFVMKKYIRESGLEGEIFVASAATSIEEIGNPVYPPVRSLLSSRGISCAGKTAVQMTKRDYREFDYIIGMDSYNLRNITRICSGDPEGKISLLLDYTDSPGSVADPWYTRDFERTYRDVCAGCKALLRHIAEENNLSYIDR